MDDEKSFTHRLYDKGEQYVKTTIELYKLKGISALAGIFSGIAIGFVIWILFFLFLLFLSIASAFYFGDLLGKSYYGFFIVTGIYAVAILILFMIGIKNLKLKVNNLIVGKLFKD